MNSPVCLFLMWLLATGSGFGQTPVTRVEGVAEYRLPNGLRIILYPEPSKQTVTVNMTYLAGSAQEDYGETGAAHLLEHLMVKGSTRFPGIWQELSNRTGPGDWNATTYVDRTNYFETFSAKDENDLRWALEMEADRMVHAKIEKRFLDLEMTVVRNEYEAGESSPLIALQARMRNTAFLWHSYGHPTIGARSDIENIPIERLQRFYRMYYRPDNAVLAVSGRFDEKRVLGWIVQYFAAITKPAAALPKRYTAEAAQEGERSVTLRRQGVKVSIVAAGYHLPAASHPESGAAMLLYGILTEGPYSRMHRALLATGKAGALKPEYEAFRERSWMLIAAESPADSPITPDELKIGLEAEIEGLAKGGGPTEEELGRAKASWLKSFGESLEEPARFGVAISEAISWGDWRLFFLQRDWVRAATVEQVRDVAAKYLQAANRTSGLLLASAKPVEVVIPPAPDSGSLLKSYKGDPLIQPGEAFDSTPANIESRTVYGTTPGGMKLAFLNKKTRGATVHAAVVLRIGNLEALTGMRGTARLTAALLMRGTVRRTGRQLQEELDRLRAKVNIRGAAGTAVIASISTTSENLPAVLGLVAEILREPALPEKDLAQLQQQAITAAESKSGDTYEAASAQLLHGVTPYPAADPRSQWTPAEEIQMLKAVTMESVRQFHGNLYGAGTSEFVAVGQYEAAAISKLAAQLFDGWRSRVPYSRIESPYVEAGPSRREIDFPGQENATYYAAVTTPIHYNHPDFVAAWVGTWLLGMGSGNGRLMKRVRIKEGLSYGTNAWLHGTGFTWPSPWVLFAICAPENLNRTEAVIGEEVEMALRDGFTEKELAEGRKTWIATRHLDFSKDDALVHFVSTALSLNKTFSWHVDIDREAVALTAAQVTAVMRKYLKPERLNVVRAGDLAKAGKP